MFFKNEVKRDSTAHIFLKQKTLPLECEMDRYFESIRIVTSLLEKWINDEMIEMVESNIALNHSLLYILKQTDLKFLGYPTPRNILLKCLKDTDSNKSGTRFLDAIIKISMMIPPYIFEVIKGRFLYGMLYVVTESNTDQPFPSKDQWDDTLNLIPWLPLLSIYQDLYESMNVETRVGNLLDEKVNSSSES